MTCSLQEEEPFTVQYTIKFESNSPKENSNDSWGFGGKLETDLKKNLLK